MTEEQLQAVATVVANMARNELRNTGELPNGVIALVMNDGTCVYRMRKLEAIIAELAGPEWLNNGRAKEAAFSVIRESTNLMPPDAVAFASVVDCYEESEAMHKLPKEERERLARELSSKELVASGWFEPPYDAVTVTVQSRERVCMFKQRYDPRERMFLGEPAFAHMPQADFRGRMKFWEEADADRP